MSDTPHRDRAYALGAGLLRSAWKPPYEVPGNEPTATRSLRVFALDPSISRANGAITVIRVPCERCEKGPRSALFEIDGGDPESELRYAEVDLDDLAELRHGTGGRAPDPADPKFHAQMVYGIALLTYESFRKAMGRHVTWAFDGPAPDVSAPLGLKLFAMRRLNAHYSRAERAASFGYALPRPRPCAFEHAQTVFTSLSSDIIAHEVSHALLDGLRPYFDEPVNRDVEALHEALADLVALFQRFGYAELVGSQLDKLGGRLTGETLLRVIAPQLGDATGRSDVTRRGLRTFEATLDAIEASPYGKAARKPTTLDDLESRGENGPHARGRVLAEALFDAFQTILNRKLDPLIGLASNGTGELPEGRVPSALLERIVHVTRRTAQQFLTICIRAIDYCPPVHVDFGDYLRAVVTADIELVRLDPHGYRDAIIAACLRRGIRPEYVPTPSESSLCWRRPQQEIAPLAELALGNLRFVSDPAVPRDAAEVERQACLFGEALAGSPALREELGLRAPDEVHSIPEIVSVRASRRIGPDDQASFTLIIEVVQHRHERIAGERVPIRGGATVVLGPAGEIRYIVRKRVDQRARLERCRAFLGDPANRRQLDRVLDTERAGTYGLCFPDG